MKKTASERHEEIWLESKPRKIRKKIGRKRKIIRSERRKKLMTRK